jgi:putative copper export protein
METQLHDVLLFLDATAALAGLVLVGGPLAFWVTVAPNGRYDRKQLLLVDVGLYVLAAATLLQPVLPILQGQALSEVPRETWAVVLVRLAVLAAIASWLPDLVAEPIQGARRAWASVAVVALATTFLAADPSSGEPRSLAVMVALLVHLVAAVVWLGGAVVIAVAGLPMRDLNLLSSQVRSFSRMTVSCVVGVVSSGVVLVVASSTDLLSVLSSTFGLVLLLKALAFAAMVVLADHGRRNLDEVLVHRLRTGADTLSGVQAWSLLMGSQVIGVAVLVAASVVLAMVGPPA